MTQLSDLAKVVETDNADCCSDFCVTGIVSYVLPFQEHYYNLLMDGDGVGVNITGSLDPSAMVKPGDVLRLKGKIVPRGAARIQPEFRAVSVIGHGAAPKPAEGTAREIMSGRHDFRRAYLVGEVRDVEPSGTSPCWNYLSIICDEEQYYAPIPVKGATLTQLESIIGSTVKLDGFPDSHNCSFRFMDERRFLVAGTENIAILKEPPDNPFEIAPSVKVLRRLSPETLRRLGRHKAAGQIVTSWQSRHALLRMGDGRNAIVNFSGKLRFPRGETVEVIGYPSTDGFMLTLSRAIARPSVGAAPFEEPPVLVLSESDFGDQLAASVMQKPSLQGQRVRLSGTITDFSDAEQERRFFRLSIAGRILEVDFSTIPQLGETIAGGCRVSVAGTCVLTSENWAILSPGVHLEGIRLVVDRPDDLVIVEHPPWWTPARLAAVVAALLLVLAAMLVWNRELRRLSEKRGRELFRERTTSALAEFKTSERTRLAAEIHDSISQILTGAAMQLDAGETGAAKRILASCRRELRCCLWDLRSHALDAADFASAVRETLAPHLGGRKLVVDLDIPSAKMSEAVRHAALCIIRESAVNAIRHGHADTIAISGELDGRRLSFTVVDNGRGFNPSSCRGSSDGHFGLLGIRERVKAFCGNIDITSAPGNGTEISVVLEDKTGPTSDLATI